MWFLKLQDFVLEAYPEIVLHFNASEGPTKTVSFWLYTFPAFGHQE